MYNTYDFKVAHPDIIKQLAVKDMLFVYYQCPQVDKQVNLFIHYNLITYTIRGKKTFYHREKSWTLTDNSCLFTRRTAYNQEKDDLEGWEVIAFYFGDDFLRQVFREYRQYLPLKNLPSPPIDMLIEINVNEITRAFFYGMIPYFTQKIPPSESLLELKFKELLFNVFSDPLNANFLAYINSIDDQYKTPLWQIMEANYTFNLSIDEFARIAQRSVATFKREFYAYYHTTPGKWLTEKRLEYAKLLLETSKKNVGEIAYASGFENLTHFSRTFKQKYLLSPLQYRNESR
ncbi:AraC family transcriptional regulator [Agriterribacter sp.]|uniref:AraC family transcriptional regulator n=1 Tax=Agriterribacter sp. TaxID=2821509 RepID=UPI002C0B124D|nr:AraC family transcriptional regulator [Agriterribacter sp.]HRO47465.1 AraC family transcriptional regulator [Agriterribacter sp.]HRQ19474.1 AraC family transcriptional regulator [Agriterribacter sp.]